MVVADECFSRAARGQPGLIVCLGEAGAGKTRLAREALEAAVDRGFLVAWGTADDTTGTPPHWPWQQVLRSLPASADLVGMAKVAGLSAELGRLVPDVFPSPSAQRPLTGSEEDRFRQFDALARLLGDLCRQHAVALVFDDLHWGDEASLLMLRHVVIGLSRERLVLWVNARENDQRHPYLLDELRRGPLARQLPLSGR
jgi:predicted ATPase